MYPVINRYDDQAFDNMSEESESNTFVVKKSLWPFQTQGIVEQAEQNGKLNASEVMRMSLDKG